MTPKRKAQLMALREAMRTYVYMMEEEKYQGDFTNEDEEIYEAMATLYCLLRELWRGGDGQ